MDAARIRSQREDAQNTFWSNNAEEMYPSGDESGETTLLFSAHTGENTSQSGLRNYSGSWPASGFTLQLLVNLVQEEQE